MFCKHDWVIVSERVTESRFEVAMRSCEGRSVSKLPAQLADATRKFIQIVQCKNCGKLKRFVEEI